MFRMITLIWVLGVMFCAMPVQAATPGTEDAGSAKSADSRATNQATRSKERTYTWQKAGQSGRFVQGKKRSRYAQGIKRSRYANAGKRSRYAQAGKRSRSASTAQRSRRYASTSRTARSSQNRVASGRSRPVAQQAQQRTARTAAYSAGVFQTGVASHYWQPQKLASGGWFNPSAMTAAHKTLPFGTRVRVTHLGNGRTVDVTINDRGPYVGGRIIDLSSGAAGVIGMKQAGLAKVKVEVIGRR